MQNTARQDPLLLLAAILENADSPMFSLDLQYGYTGFNQAHAEGMKKLYGTDIQLGHSLTEYMTNAADWEFTRNKLEEAFQGKSFMASACMGNVALNRRYLAFFYSPVRDAEHKISGVVIFAHSIDDRPAAMHMAMETLQLSVENAGASIMITNTEGAIEYVNAKFSEITGYSPQECLGKNPRLLKDPDRPSRDYKELWETLSSGRTWRGIFRNVKKNGSFYWEAASISPVFDETGKIVRFVAVKDDITERHRLEEVLRKSEGKYRELARKIPVSLCFVNNEEQVTFINDRFTETFGYTEEDLAAFSDWWRLAFPEDKYRRAAIKTWSEVVMAAVLKKQDIEPREYNVVCKNGAVRTVAISGGIIADGFLATFIDVTERRRQDRLLKAAFERKKKSNLMNELVTASLPSRQTLAACARMLGMRATEPFNCFLVMVDHYKGQPHEAWIEYQDEYQRTADSLVDELSDETCITWLSAEGIGIICFGPLESKSAADLKNQQIQQAKGFLTVISRHFPEIEVSIGIAERAETLTEIGVHYRQALVAARSGRKMWQQRKLHHYLDIGVFQVLPYISDQKQVNDYIKRVLGGLLQYEKKKKIEFMQTLEVILLSDNLKEAADLLSVHYKTLMFRKQRLEEILGVSLDNFSSRMAVATALSLMKLQAEKAN